MEQSLLIQDYWEAQLNNLRPVLVNSCYQEVYIIFPLHLAYPEHLCKVIHLKYFSEYNCLITEPFVIKVLNRNVIIQILAAEKSVIHIYQEPSFVCLFFCYTGVSLFYLVVTRNCPFFIRNWKFSKRKPCPSQYKQRPKIIMTGVFPGHGRGLTESLVEGPINLSIPQTIWKEWSDTVNAKMTKKVSKFKANFCFDNKYKRRKLCEDLVYMKSVDSIVK